MLKPNVYNVAMVNEPISNLAVNAVALAMLAVLSMIALIVVQLRGHYEELEEFPFHEIDEYDVNEPLPKYDEEAPPLYTAGPTGIYRSDSAYAAELGGKQFSPIPSMN